MFDTLMILLKEFFEKVDFEKNQQTTKNIQNEPVGERVLHYSYSKTCLKRPLKNRQNKGLKNN